MANIAVIIPLYNCEKYIEDCLESLIRQRDDCVLDIVVVNDGSTDASLLKVEAIADRHDFIKIITTPNSGVSKSRNVGLNNLPHRAEYVSFIDSDDISPSGRFAADLKILNSNPKIDFVYGRMHLTKSFDANLVPEVGAPQVIVRGISLSAAIFRRSYIDKIGLIDEEFIQGEDTDYLLRSFESTENYKLVETICVYYRKHENNMTRDKSTALNGFMLALRKSLVRRKLNPSHSIPPDIFDISNLQDSELL